MKKKSDFLRNRTTIIVVSFFAFLTLALFILDYTSLFSTKYDSIADAKEKTENKVEAKVEPKKLLDFADYDQRMLALATASSTISVEILADVSATTTGTSTASSTVPSKPKKVPLWPAKAVYPNVDAILPFKRIVAYYGNFLSTKMGVLGQYPAPEMLTKLKAEVKKWEAADPTTPVMPAIDYIAVTAQGSAGADGKYRARMSDEQIDKAIDLAGQVNGIVFLEIQAGLSTLSSEIPALEKYLKMPQVHLALDPEFYMQRSGSAPGRVIGTMDASDVNWAANYLANLVRENNLPPKILIVHRFTSAMVTNAENIKPLSEVQIIMDMDGWGSPARKNTTYTKIVATEPVQFTGFKLFYKNDILPPSPGMMSMEEILKLKPRPIFIQYQ
ncbi:TPA: hypothetical protein DCQ44_03075 [Candidatus Taylorbacteria bacterium]|nr:hypothetical protein [Candidatus Taylorbacteria bacterium]